MQSAVSNSGLVPCPCNECPEGLLFDNVPVGGGLVPWSLGVPRYHEDICSGKRFWKYFIFLRVWNISE